MVTREHVKSNIKIGDEFTLFSFEMKGGRTIIPGVVADFSELKSVERASVVSITPETGIKAWKSDTVIDCDMSEVWVEFEDGRRAVSYWSELDCPAHALFDELVDGNYVGWFVVQTHINEVRPVKRVDDKFQQAYEAYPDLVAYCRDHDKMHEVGKECLFCKVGIPPKSRS